jgi:hypothetical protein
MRRSASAVGLLVALTMAACGSAYDDPTGMTCARLAHDARARILMTDAIDNRLHARSMMPLRPLPTPGTIAAEIARRCAFARAPRRERPYGEALQALG